MTKQLIITGGSRGIGKETISLFSKNGWRTANISRSDCDIDDCLNINVDLTQDNWVDSITEQLSELAKSADQVCLVHNAAAFEQDSILDLDDNKFRSVLEFNIVAPSILNKAVIPHMKPSSSVIYIGSTLSEMGVPGRASYVITKHALVGMMRATTQDLAGKGITTCCICPGFVNTTMLTDQVDKDVLNEIIKAKVSAGRLVEPDEIAEFIHFCAHNPIINGSVLHANLGQITT